jgi:Dockerin type I domain
LNGVTTLDIALMSKHILDIQPLATPYRIIAGDVNRDGELSAIDMLQTRRMILRVITQFAGGKTWRFVDKRYLFDNPSDPLSEDFPESVILTNIPSAAQANFIGIKIGDVSGNAWSGAPNALSIFRGANKALTFEADDVQMDAGKDYTVTIRAADFNAQGFKWQFARYIRIKFWALQKRFNDELERHFHRQIGRNFDINCACKK